MFALHPRLEADTTLIADWPLCRVLLNDDCTYPWLVLVPRHPGIAEIGDLAPADRATLVEEIARASAALRAHLAPERINVAALGNVVPQLHVHLIARFTTDPAWPRPVWGVVPTARYGAEALAAEAALWRRRLAEF